MGVARKYCTKQEERGFNIIMGSSNGKPVLRDEDVAALAKSSGLDEAQVKQAFDNFVTEHPNGKMKPKDFREMMEKALPGKDAKKMEKHVFRIYDTNNDGYIAIKEMNRLVKDMYSMLKSEDPNLAAKDLIAKSAFAEMDENQDGKVSCDEFVKACMERDEFTKMLTLKIIDIFVED